VWFPIAAGLVTPVPELEQQVPVLGGPHRGLEIADLPVPAITVEGVGRRAAARPGRKAGAPARRRAWAQARPGVRVDERPTPDIPVGYLLLDRLDARAAAWCGLDGRFGVVEWTGRRIHTWATELDGTVQTLRAGGGAIILATAEEVRCLDPGSGDLLWSHPLRGGQQLLDATREVMVVMDGKRVVAASPDRGELWSTRAPGGPVAARVSDGRLVVGESGRVRVVALASGEEEWHAKTTGEVLVADDRLLVPGGSHTSVVYSLGDSTAKKVKTSVPLSRTAAPGVRLLDGPVVATVTGGGDVVLLDLPNAAEVASTAPVPGPVEGAWLAGPFLITARPLSVSHLWGGVATPIPLDADPAAGGLVTGAGQALVRSADRNAWLVFS
jgi:hypothetical protein